MRAKGQMVAASDTERLRKLEAEVAGLKAALDEARGRLTRYEAIEGVLAQSGRLVR
jgi:tetrahydromethanopterin S-methyltransferase subunit B